MFKAITPKFVKSIDNYLLVNYPILWVSKLHFVLWHGGILWVLSALLGAFLPIDLKQNIEYEVWHFLFTVIGVVILCFWIYNYLIFNKEKEYGSKKLGDEYGNFLLVFFSVSIFLLIPWPFEMIYSARVANMYDDKQVLMDIDKLNEIDPYMAHSTNNYHSWYDTTTHVQYFNLRKLNPYGSTYYTPYHMRADSAKYPELQTEFELSHKYRPTSDLTILKEKVATYKEIAAKYDIYVDASNEEIAKRYAELLSKDRVPSNDFYSYSYGGYQYQLTNTFNNLCEAKFKSLFIFEAGYLWVMFYFVITIVSFLLLFKISYWQQFLIMIVILLLYPLITFIFSQLLPYSSSSGVFVVSLILMIFFSGISLIVTATNHHHYLPFYNIFNQLFYVTLISTPLLIVVFLHEHTGVFHKNDYWNNAYDVTSSVMGASEEYARTHYNQTLESYEFQYWVEEYQRWLLYARYGGIALFLLGLPFFKELFVKQISLPKKS